LPESLAGEFAGQRNAETGGRKGKYSAEFDRLDQREDSALSCPSTEVCFAFLPKSITINISDRN
jgi:hypothetical protein